MAQQIRDGLHRHIPAHHLGRKGVSEDVGARPRNGDAGAVQRSNGDTRHASAAELPIRGQRGCEEHAVRAGRGARAQRADQGLPDVGGQRQPSLPSPFAGYTDGPVVPVDIVHREGRDLSCPEAKPDQQQQDGAVTKPARAGLVHRGQHPLDVLGGHGAWQRGVLPLADGRHGTVHAGRNHTAGSEEAQKRPGGGDSAPPRRRTEPVGPRLYERRDRRDGEPGPVGRRRPRELGKKGCGIAPVHAPGPDDQAVHMQRDTGHDDDYDQLVIIVTSSRSRTRNRPLGIEPFEVAERVGAESTFSIPTRAALRRRLTEEDRLTDLISTRPIPLSLTPLTPPRPNHKQPHPSS